VGRGALERSQDGDLRRSCLTNGMLGMKRNMPSIPLFLTDWEGRRYAVQVVEDSAQSFEVNLTFGGRYVGRAVSTSRSRYEVEFSDVELEPPYRRKGLGTKLVKLVITRLRERGVRHIYGSVPRSALEEFPEIVQWYERLGFKNGERYPVAVPGAVAYLHLDLLDS